jgi:hypothetical protein
MIVSRLEKGESHLINLLGPDRVVQPLSKGAEEVVLDARNVEAFVPLESIKPLSPDSTLI